MVLKRLVRPAVAAAALSAALLTAPVPARGSSNTWTQQDWSTLDAVSYATHPADASGWSKYQAKSDTITYIPGTGLQLLNRTFSWTTTDNTTSTAGFHYTGSTWTAGMSSPIPLTLPNAVIGYFGGGSDGDFNTATYVSGIPGILKVSATAYTINTDASPNAGVYYFGNFTVGVGSAVTVSGSKPLVLFAASTVSISGVFSSSGAAGGGGAGGCGGGAGGYGSNGSGGYGGTGGGVFVGSWGGGGGGGYGTGGCGYFCTGGAASAVGGVGVSVATGVYGGGGGGAGSGGGGAIYIRASNVAIPSSGRVNVNGGYCGNCGANGGGGGGGGSIRIDTFIFTNSGSISANGGDGTGPGSGGRIRINADNYSNTGSTSVLAGVGTTAAASGKFSSSTFSGLFSGLYTSGIFNTGGQFDFTDISWSSSVPTGASIVTEVRAGNTASPDGSWTTWAPFTNGQSLGGSMDYLQYVQWRSSFTTVDASTSPVLYDLTIRYAGYDQAYNDLTSSVYNTGSSSNSLRRVMWGQIKPPSTEIKVQLRTSPDGNNWTVWMGTNGASSSYFTDSAGGETLPYILRDGADDRYFQYKLTLKGSGANAPTVSVASVTYGSLAIPVLNDLLPDSSTQIRLSFTDNSDDEFDFKIATGVITGPSTDMGTIVSTDSAGTGFRSSLATGLLPNKLYFIRLRSHETATGGYSSFSNELSTFTLASSPAVSTKPYEPTASSLKVYWEANNNPSGTQFYIEGDDDPNYGSPLGQSGWTTQTSQTFGGLALGTTYYFRVKAQNNYGQETAAVNLHAAQPVTQPAPAAQTFVNVWATSMTVQWDANGNGADTVYTLKRSTPLHSWPLNNTWNASVGGNDLGPTNSPTFVSTGTGYAASFNGTNQYVTSAQNTGVAGAVPKTLSFWFYPTAAGNRDVMSWGSSGKFGVLFNGSRQLYFLSSGFGDFTCPTQIALNTWNHVAVTYDGTTVRVYLNGVLETYGVIGLSGLTDSPLSIGYPKAWNYFSGSIDEVRIFGSALSVDDLSLLISSDGRYGSPATGTSRTVTGLTPNTTYPFSVQAANPSGDEAPGWVSLGSTVTSAAQPGFASAGVPQERSVQFDWNVNGNPAGTNYRVQISADPGFSTILASSNIAIADAWTDSDSGLIANTGYNNGSGGALVSTGGDFLYAFPGNGQNLFRRYSISGNSWTALNPPGYTVGNGGALAYGGGDFIYAFPGYAQNLFLRYSISGGNWTVLAAPGYTIGTVSATDNSGAALAYDGQDSIYAFPGTTRNVFLRYSISGNNWTTMKAPGSNIASGGQLVYAGGNRVYAFPGNGQNVFQKYNTSDDTWTTMTAPGINVGFGQSAYDGGNYIYAAMSDDARGTGTTNVLKRYSISLNSWDFWKQAAWVGDASALAYAGGYVYYIPGHIMYCCGSGWQQRTNFTRYGGVKPMAFAGLAPMTTYYARISGVNSAGTATAWTDLGSARTLLMHPVFSTFSVVGPDAITIDWTTGGNPGGVEYYIELSTSGSFSGSENKNSGWTTAGAYAFTGLSLSKQYYFRGRAREVADPANVSQVVALSGVSTTPNPPTASAHLFVSSGSVKAAWGANGNGGSTQYYAERATDSGFTQNVTSSSWTTALNYNFATTPNTYYYFRVKAKNSVNVETTWVNLPDQRTYAAPPKTPALTNVYWNSVNFSWDPDNNPTSWTDYWVEIATGNPQGTVPSPWVVFSTVGWTYSNPVTFAGLTAQTTYWFKAKARNLSALDTLYSTPISTRTPNQAVAPSGLYVNLDSSLIGDTDRLYLRWTDNSSDEQSFGLERSLNADVWSAVTNLSANTTFYQDTLLSPGTSCYYRVRSYSAGGGYSLWSATAAAATRAIAPTGAAAAVAVTSVTLNWTAPARSQPADGKTNPSETRYVVEISTDSYATLVQGATVTVAAVPYAFTGLKPATTYCSRVRALNPDGVDSASSSAGCADTSDVFAPTLTSLTAVSSTQVQAVWLDNTPAEDEFKLYVDVAASPTSLYATRPTGNKTGVGVADGFTLGTAGTTELTPNTSYYVRLKARETAYGVSSAYSNELSTYTLAAPPTSPAFATVWATSMTATWGADNNPVWTRYAAEVSTAADFSGTLISSVTLNASALWTGLSGGASYYLRVRALNEYGVATANVSPAAPTMMKADLPGTSAAAYALASDAATVRWDVLSNVATVQYRAQRSLGNTNDFSVVGDDSQWQANASAWTFTFLQPDTTYYFRVKARNASAVETGWVVLASTQTLANTPTAGAPDVWITSVTARWAVDAGISYKAELSADAGFSSILQSAGWQTGLGEYAFTGLDPDTNYFIRARSRNGALNESPNAPLYSAYTRAAQPAQPLAPYTRAGNAVTVNWDPGANPAGFTEYYGVAASTADFSAGASSSGWTTSNAYNFTGLNTDTTYYFRVKARNHNATPLETPWTILPSTVTKPAPAPPTELVVSHPDAASTNKLKLDWLDNSTAEAGYRIYKSTDGAAFSQVGAMADSAGTGPMTYTEYSLSSNTVYWFQVGAYNNNPGESFSNAASSFTRAAKPDGGAFSGVLSNVMTVNWGAAGNPSGTPYVCEVSSDSAGTFLWVSASSSTKNAWAGFSGLEANATYYARVKAVNGGGVSTDYHIVGSTLTVPLEAGFYWMDVAPATIVQGEQKTFVKAVVEPSGTGVRWTSLSLTRTGTGADADVARVSVRRDGNNDGVYQSGNDPEAGWGLFASSAVVVSLNETINSAATYFLVLTGADTSLSWPGNTLGLTVGAAVSPNANVTQLPAGLSTAVSAIVKKADVLSLTGASVVATPNVSRGMSNVAFLKLTLQAQRDRAYMRALTVKKLGSAPLADLSYVKLWRDANGNGTLEAGSGDELSSSGTDLFVSSQAVLWLANPTTHTVTNVAAVYFLTVDLPDGAALGETVGVRIENAAAATLMSGVSDTVSLGVTPTDSAAPSISDPPNTLTVAAADLATWPTIEQGQTQAFLKLDMSVDSGNALLKSVKLARAADSVDGDYSMAALYRDNPPYGAFGAEDSMAASGTFSGGQLTLGLSETIPQASPKTYFAVTSVAANANTSNKAGLSIASGQIKAASAQTAISASFPIKSSTVPIAATVDIVDATPDLTVAPAYAYQGSTGVPLLALKVQSRSNSAVVWGLSVAQAGTAYDSDVASLKVYKDNGDGAFGAGDSALTGSYAFSGGVAVLSFAAQQVVTTSSAAYFIVGAVAEAAVPNRTVSLRLASVASVGVMTPDVSASTFPILSNPVTLSKYPAVVLLSTASLSPASAQAGASAIPMLKFSARTDKSTAEIPSLSLLKVGGADGDVAEAALYCDSNADGTLESYEKVSSGTFSGGLLTLGLAGSAKNLSTSPKDYYLTMSLAADAAVGAEIAFNATALAVASPDSLEADRLPFGSGYVKVAEPPVQLVAAFGSMIPSSMTQGDVSVLAATLTVRSSGYTVGWTGLNLLKTGTALAGDVGPLKLYLDNGNGVWEGPGTETFLSSASFSGVEAALAFSTQSVTSSDKLYFITADAASNATPGATFALSVPAASYLTVEAPDAVSATGLPWSSAVSSITATRDALLVAWASLAPAVKQGDVKKALGRLTLSADANTASWTAVRVDKTGTALDSDIGTIRLYRDDGDGLFSAGADALVASAAGLTNGSANLTLSDPASIGVTVQEYFVTADFSAAATVGLTFGLSASSASFSVTAPDVVSLDSTPLAFSIAGTISDSSDTVRLTFLDLASTSLYKGSAKQQIARLRLSTLGDQASLTAVKASLTGSATLGDLGTVRLYADADGDGAFSDSADTVVASGTFTSALIILTPAAPQVLTTTPRDFFLALDVADAAAVGNTVGISLSNETFLTLAGVDGVEPFTGLAATVGTIRDPNIPTPPVVRVLKGDGSPNETEPGYSPYETRALFTWDGTVITGGVERAEWCIAASPCGGASAWTSVGLTKSATVLGLNLTSGDTYYLSVRTKNTLGAYYSDVVSRRFIVDSLKPVCSAAPTQVVEGATVKLAWSAAAVGPSGLAYYRVEERRGSSPLWVTAATTTLNSFAVNQAGAGPLDVDRPAGTYYYRVRAVNAAGVVGEPGPEITVQLGVDGLPPISAVSSYPNPFDSRKGKATINFALNAASDVRIEIYSLFGGKVKTLNVAGLAGSANNVVWDGADESGRKVSKGLYLAVFTASGSKTTFKIGVIR